MVLFYNIEGNTNREIIKAEHNTMIPTIPANMTFDEKKRYYREEEKLEFIALPYEMGGYVFDYNVCLDSNGNFIGLQPKGLQK